ncbi:MAG: glycine--tRNA ligase [Dehalococcoidia bacterium]|nr:glycine--tRNA ligase [Dehalococcoidia bacterium]
MEKLVSLCKRRGLIYPGSDIYGGLGSLWDYGPLGSELKRNVKDAWWRAVVWQRDDVVGLDAAILMHPQTWVASGHAEGFTDPLVECKSCHHRFRTDHLQTPACPDCGGELTASRQFSLMLKTFLGPVEDTANQVWLRPETAQGIFVNFQNVLTTTRRKLPFGIAQIGKSFRNEITPGNFIFRTREFEQMEIEYFVKPGADEQWHQHWLQERMRWYTDLGIRPENLRLRRHDPTELAHYAKDTYDIEYRFPWGWGELEGIANRTDFDLKRHAEFSGRTLDYYDEETKEHIVPYVIEPSGGVDRALLAFLVDAYDEEPELKGDGRSDSGDEGARRRDPDRSGAPGGERLRTVLHLHPALAPVKVAVLPLSRNEKLAPTARQVYQTLRQRGRWSVEYDDAQSIGRRYRRQDEVGTLYCVTVDFKTVEGDPDTIGTVTIRDRDTMEQVRVPIPELVDALKERLER